MKYHISVEAPDEREFIDPTPIRHNWPNPQPVESKDDREFADPKDVRLRE